MIRGVIFDLDGVLTDTAELHYRAWKKLADEEGWPFDRRINERLRGVSRRASLEIILDGRRIPEEQMVACMERKNRYYQEMLDSISPADLYPGVRETIRFLKAHRVRIGVGSASRNAPRILRQLQIAEACAGLRCEGTDFPSPAAGEHAGYRQPCDRFRPVQMHPVRKVRENLQRDPEGVCN